MRPTIEQFAIQVAEAASIRSEDPEHKVGAAVLGHDGRVLGVGYNGPPPGIDLSDALWQERDMVRALTVHAETNALIGIQPGSPWLLATTLGPCSRCIGIAARLGVTKIISSRAIPERYREDSLNAIGCFDIDFAVLGVTSTEPVHLVQTGEADAFQIETRRTGGQPVPSDTSEWQSRMANWAMGLTGEAGEVADLLKKVIYHKVALDIDELEKELGDVLWYVARVADEASIPLGQVIRTNVTKLRERYPDGFVEGGGNR